MKIVGFLCTFNDSEYLDFAIESLKHHIDKLFIIEGSWQSSIKFGEAKRSNEETYRIINKHIDNNKTFLIQANEPREREQRQIGLEVAKKEQADWCWMLDSDEIYIKSSILKIKKTLERTPENVLGYRLNSYNFINSFKKWYNGNYMRIYRVTDGAKFFMDNDVMWPDRNGIISQIPGYSFYHYNYVKLNSRQFHRKMFYQNDQDPTFNQRVLPQYGHDEIKKIYKIPSDIPLYNFTGKHPNIMKNHSHVIQDVFGDGKLDFLEE